MTGGKGQRENTARWVQTATRSYVIQAGLPNGHVIWKLPPLLLPKAKAESSFTPSALYSSDWASKD